MAVALHIKLLTDIVDMFDIESPEYKKFVYHMTDFVPKGILNSKPTLLDKFDAMKSRGKLNVGKYEHLKKVAEDSGNNDVLELIKIREPSIFEEKAREDSSSAKINIVYTRASLDSGQCVSHLAAAGGSSTAAVKKRKIEEVTDCSDPLYACDAFGRGKYDTEDKRGYLLILNSEYERTGLRNAVRDLETFFGSQLGFHVKTVSSNLTTDKVWRELGEARELLNGDTRRQYYAFVCVILSHGNEEGILAHGRSGKLEPISLNEIRKHFCNSNDMRNFTGRPKVFFIDSCQGYKPQELHDAKDEDDYKKEAIIDESDQIFQVPTDADTLVAFANTPGYATFGNTWSTQSTCFTSALLDVFQRFYKRDHIEDMLISVREAIALGDTKYYHPAALRETKQMPCVWSTLTKRLYLTAFTD